MEFPFRLQGDTNLAEQEQVYRLASLVQPAKLKVRPVRQDRRSLRNNQFKSSTAEANSHLFSETSYNPRNKDEVNEKRVKIPVHPVELPHIPFHPRLLARLSRLLRLNTIQKPCKTLKQVFHPLHRLHRTVHPDETEVETLTNNKNQFFTHFILVSGDRER